MEKINTTNEYSDLKKVIVGRVDDGNQYPRNDLGMLANIAHEEKISLHEAQEKIPYITKEMISTTQKELEVIVNFLKSQGAEVFRPEPVAPDQKIITPTFETTQFPVFCPRDIILPIGNLLIVSPNLYQSRVNEGSYYRDILNDHQEKGHKIICAPRPRLRKQDFNLDLEAETILDTKEPVFEAANVLKDNENIYYQISNSGNIAGLKWLKDTLKTHHGDKFNVEPLHVYNGTHIDTTISILNKDTIILNPDRIKKDLSNLPESLRKRKNIIWAPKMTEKKKDALSSEWIGMNVFSYSPNGVIVDASQKELIKEIEKQNISVQPMTLTHSGVLEGGFHCITSDTERSGDKEK